MNQNLVWGAIFGLHSFCCPGYLTRTSQNESEQSKSQRFVLRSPTSKYILLTQAYSHFSCLGERIPHREPSVVLTKQLRSLNTSETKGELRHSQDAFDEYQWERAGPNRTFENRPNKRVEQQQRQAGLLLQEAKFWRFNRKFPKFSKADFLFFFFFFLPNFGSKYHDLQGAAVTELNCVTVIAGAMSKKLMVQLWTEPQQIPWQATGAFLGTFEQTNRPFAAGDGISSPGWGWKNAKN